MICSFDSAASPWRAKEGSLADVTEAIVATVPRACEGTQLVASQTTAEGSYLRFEVNGLFGKDIVEFVAKEDRTATRQNDGDVQAPLVFYRSIARELKCPDGETEQFLWVYRRSEVHLSLHSAHLGFGHAKETHGAHSSDARMAEGRMRIDRMLLSLIVHASGNRHPHRTMTQRVHSLQSVCLSIRHVNAALALEDRFLTALRKEIPAFFECSKLFLVRYEMDMSLPSQKKRATVEGAKKQWHWMKAKGIDTSRQMTSLHHCIVRLLFKCGSPMARHRSRPKS